MGKVIYEDADKELFIDEDELDEESANQPLTFRKWTKLKAEVNAKTKIIKQKLKQAEAEAYLFYKNDGQGNKVKDLESLVETDEEIIKLRNELIEAEKLSEEYEGIVRAFHQRHEALKDLSANKRKELSD